MQSEQEQWRTPTESYPETDTNRRGEMLDMRKNGPLRFGLQTNGPKFAFAPKVIRMNYLQEISDQENDYSEGEQNNSVGND